MVINAEAAGVENEAFGNAIAPQGLAYSCMAEGCDFKKPVCFQEGVACQLLVMHTNLFHKNREDVGRSKLGHKIWLPKEMSLMLKLGLIQKSYSAWRSQLEVVKDHGEWQLLVNYTQ